MKHNGFEGCDAAKGGVSMAPRAHTSIPKGKTNMNTGAVKGNKVGSKSNTPKRDNRSGVHKTTPMNMVK